MKDAEAVVQRCFVKIKSEKVSKIYKKTPVSESQDCQSPSVSKCRYEGYFIG